MNLEPVAAALSSAPFSVGQSRVDARANEIRRGAETVKLEPKVMQVLCLLAEQPGNVVSREELEAQAWPGLVVTTDAVTGTIIKLRKALGDSARHPRYIETVSKSGYRLIAGVDRHVPSKPTPKTSSRWKGSVGVLSTLLLLAATGLLWLRPSENKAPAPPTEAQDPEHRPGIAVLPFENVGADPKNEYFADGITEDLITDLSKLSGLRVIARNSTLAYKGSSKNEKTVARELGVDYLLRGSVQRSSDRIRINVGLIDGKWAANLWGERYDREMDDIFEIQDEIAWRIVAALEVEIGPTDRSRLARDRLASVQAYDAFLQGLDHYGRRSEEESRLAIQYYERAIAIDPGFARAYAGLALVYSRDAADGWDLTARDALALAEELTEKARRLDPSVPQIYFVDSQIELFRRNYEAAIRNAEHALSIKPSYADAHALLAWILHFAGRPKEGLASMQRAVILNPRVPAVYRLVRGALHYSREELDEALADLEAAVESNPSFQLQRIWLAVAYAATGRTDDARWEGQEILALDPDFTTAQVERALPIRDPAYRERLLNDLRTAGLPD